MTALTTKFEEVQLIYRNKTKAQDRPHIRTAEDAYDILKEYWDHDQIELIEEAIILLLDRSLRLMSIAPLSKGGMSGTVVDAKVLYAIGLKRRAHAIILAHNHPSGQLRPSREDIRLTQNLTKVGEALSLPLEDHLIVTKDGFCSIMEHI